MALVVQWTAEEKAAFLNQQFYAQHTYYQHQYRNAAFSIALLDGVPAGRLYVDERATDIRIVDITLLPKFRNLGLGQFILTNLQQKACHEGKSLSIHVERDNRALHLYERLGFQVINDSHPVYLLMTWQDNL
jgi:ribosomal protein S18 acetylase RimI-like enzyme